MLLSGLRIGPDSELNVFQIEGNTEADRQTPMFGRGRIDHLALEAASVTRPARERLAIPLADCNSVVVTPPEGLPTLDEFNEQNEARRGSRVLSYGSSWKQPGWTDDSHVVELLWIGATHELVAFYLTYDWNRLAPGRMSRDAAIGGDLDILVDSGYGVGRMLNDVDIATSEIDVEVLATLHSDLACHELLWGWQWWQHHAEGLEHVRARAREATP